MLPVPMRVALVLSLLSWGCEGRREPDPQVAAWMAAEAARAAQQEAAARERARIDGLARRFTYNAGEQIMNAVGGGQDLIVRFGEWQLDGESRRVSIPMSVSFNGAVFRANKYQVTGILTIGEDGSNPRFARDEANDNYLAVENLLQVTAAGLTILQSIDNNGTR